MAQDVEELQPGDIVAIISDHSIERLGLRYAVFYYGSSDWDGFLPYRYCMIADPVTCRGGHVSPRSIRKAGALETLAFLERWDTLSRSTKVKRVLENLIRRYIIGYK